MSSRTLVMGIVNVTPDSFSDGGMWLDEDAAVAHGLELVALGADIIDVGGESTRPDSERVSETEELRRVLPVIDRLVRQGIRVSIDTTRATVATEAVDVGASIVNDVSGGLADPRMFAAVAETDADYVVMHWRGHAKQMGARASYRNVVAEVISETETQVNAAVRAGIPRGRIIVDPGIGFAKTAEHNWELLRKLDDWDAVGLRLLLGVSRKRFLGELLGVAGVPRPALERDAATMAITALAASQGVWCVRTHSVRENADAVRVLQRLNQSSAFGPEPAVDA